MSYQGNLGSACQNIPANRNTRRVAECVSTLVSNESGAPHLSELAMLQPCSGRHRRWVLRSVIRHTDVSGTARCPCRYHLSFSIRNVDHPGPELGKGCGEGTAFKASLTRLPGSAALMRRRDWRAL